MNGMHDRLTGCRKKGPGTDDFARAADKADSLSTENAGSATQQRPSEKIAADQQTDLRGDHQITNKGWSPVDNERHIKEQKNIAENENQYRPTDDAGPPPP